jgi:hypothetical protein
MKIISTVFALSMFAGFQASAQMSTYCPATGLPQDMRTAAIEAIKERCAKTAENMNLTVDLESGTVCHAEGGADYAEYTMRIFAMAKSGQGAAQEISVTLSEGPSSALNVIRISGACQR